jgi:hypothetical protein
MSYEEEDTCHMRRRIHDVVMGMEVIYICICLYLSIYEEEDTCHMRRRMHGLAYSVMDLSIYVSISIYLYIYREGGWHIR